MEPKAHNRVYKSPPLVPILSQMNSINRTQSYFLKINLLLPFHLLLDLPSGLFPSVLSTQILYSTILILIKWSIKSRNRQGNIFY
jgi:hypothetical protein